MAVMTQEQMQELIRGGSIVDDSSMDVQLRHITGIALAAVGDDLEALRAVLKDYADELEELVKGAHFYLPVRAWDARDHLVWLRSI